MVCVLGTGSACTGFKVNGPGKPGPETLTKHTVRFDAGGGSGVDPLEGVEAGALITEPEAPVKTGYDFAGWYRDSNYLAKFVFNTHTINSDTTLYAFWTGKSYTLTFDYQWSLAPEDRIREKEVVHGDEVGDLPSVSRTNYNFLGWYSAISGGERFSMSTVYSLSADSVWYARYSVVVELQVSFEIGQGTLVSGDLVQAVPYGEAATAPVVTRTGYDLRWSDAFDEVSSQLTVTAIWTPKKYRVSYDLDGGRFVNIAGVADGDDVTAVYGKQFLGSAKELPVAAKAGYSFGGWFTGRDGTGRRIRHNTVFDIADDTVLYPKYDDTKMFGIFEYGVSNVRSDNALKDTEINSDFVNVFVVGLDSASDFSALDAQMNKIHAAGKYAWLFGYHFIFNYDGQSPMTVQPESDVRRHIGALYQFISDKDYYDNVLGIFIDEPMIKQLSPEGLAKGTQWTREEMPDKRIYVNFASYPFETTAKKFDGYTVPLMTPTASKNITDISFDLYSDFSRNKYDSYVSNMHEYTNSTGRIDVLYWYMPGTMLYYHGSSNYTYADESKAISHFDGMINYYNADGKKGGIMCYTYYTIDNEFGSSKANIGLEDLLVQNLEVLWHKGDAHRAFYNANKDAWTPWTSLWARIVSKGREII